MSAKPAKDEEPFWGDTLLGFVLMLTVYPVAVLIGFVCGAAAMGFERGRRDFLRVDQWADSSKKAVRDTTVTPASPSPLQP